MSDMTSIIEEAMLEPVPEPADDIVTLPGGVLVSNVLKTQVRIKELTGADEEALARASRHTSDPFAMFRSIIENCLVDVGGTKPTPDIINSMLIGDRDAILMAIRVATYGSEYETRITCPKCSLDTDIALDLVEDIPERKLEDPERVLRTVPLRKPGSEAELRLVAVADQADAVGDSTRTPAEMNTILLGRVVHKINGQEALGAQSMRELSAGDRRILIKYLLDTQPGPQMGEVVATCSHCMVESTIPLAMAALFL
jgi:hypothetical protein